ncbi:hypothetical protein Rcae01_04672 [Novipirellula caenicola]|uniref:Secreted protein n=1 Tax=Novipirellula caenicola TaxID=1536901 RepID=A0ABP9VVI9_9BACT
MFKKFLCVLVVACFALSFTGCGTSDESTVVEHPPMTPEDMANYDDAISSN